MIGENVEEGEDSKLSFELLFSDLRLEIIARLCESVDSKAQVVFDGKMIRYFWKKCNLIDSRHWSGEKRDNWN